MGSKSDAARRRWERGTRARTEAHHERIAAEAQAGAASILAPAITRISENGAEAELWLRAGAVLQVNAPGMGIIATIRAGDGWATAVISPRVLNGAPGSGSTGERGEVEPFSNCNIEPYAPNIALFYKLGPLCPAPLADAVRAAALALHPDWEPGQLNAEVQRVWDDMRAVT